MAQIINNQSSGDDRSKKINFWEGSIFFSFFTRNDPRSKDQSRPTARMQTWHSAGSNYTGRQRREVSLNGEQCDEVDVVQLPSSPLGHLLPCLQ